MDANGSLQRIVYTSMLCKVITSVTEKMEEGAENDSHALLQIYRKLCRIRRPLPPKQSLNNEELTYDEVV
jgi:hypothetical protein